MIVIFSIHRWITITLLIVVICLLPHASFSVEPSEMLSDPAQEARAREISKGLRCVVCRNQSIDDSNAEIARDLRIVLRERIAAGETDEEAVAYLVDRYGSFILLKPPFQMITYLLWFGPMLILIAALFGFRTLWRKGTADMPEQADQTVEDKALIASILEPKDIP